MYIRVFVRAQVTFDEMHRYESDDSDVFPIAECIRTLQAHRSCVVELFSRLPLAERDALLSRVLSTSLRQPRLLKALHWIPAEADVMCSANFETPHPYEPGYSRMEVFHFPGAPFIRISFANLCCTEYGFDFVSIYKGMMRTLLVIFLYDVHCVFLRTDEACTEFWGRERMSGKHGWASSWAWPGAWGQNPLVFPTDKVVILFKSTMAASVADTSAARPYGLKIRLEAPVPDSSVKRLLQSVPPSDAGCVTPTASICKRLLAMCNNDIAEACKCRCSAFHSVRSL